MTPLNDFSWVGYIVSRCKLDAVIVYYHVELCNASRDLCNIGVNVDL